MEIFGYILTFLCLVGTALNCKMIRYCFIIWFFANIGWIIHDGYTEQYYRVLLDVVQAGTAIWGWLEWTSNNKFTK